MDELLARQLPHSLEAEQATLGSMLIDARCVPEVIEQLKPEDFYLQQNRDIFETIYTMFSYSQRIDPVTVLDQMRQRGIYEETTSRKYVLQLMEITPTAANVKEYVKIVRDQSLLRHLSEAASEISQTITEGTSAADALDAAERKIYALRHGRGKEGLYPLSAVLFDVYTRLAELAKSDNAIPGLSTGLADLDHMISGLNRSDLILLASRPGMGKTSMALNIALHAGKFSGKTVVMFSLEMSREQLGMRLLSTESFIDNKKLLTGRLSDADWNKLTSATAVLNQIDLQIDDNPVITVADMNAKCRRVENLGLVIIDYLQLMQSAGTKQSNNGENRQQIVAEITRSLKIMAKELNVPVLCLSQLSRANEARSNKRPMLSDLRESGAIEQDADIVLFLYREDYYNENSENHNVAECIVAKNRHGETGTISLQWLPEYTAFSSLEWKHHEE
ncbi:MAG: replicative DNA helicase [Oscillospiraceae bacterium]|nr:replicative DNA helicase [Oscillospiraceae bacterium]